ncbi:MAG: TonB-dependent receptor, partial [Rhodothermales bacterium]|nr:TonB-dependent receptor [Rhodothermales bacterium]
MTDGRTGEGLPGVNIVIEGTTQGTATDLDGYYVILNVTPGTYALRATFIGFTPEVVQGVRVKIDQTSTVDIALDEETIGIDEVVVTAERPVVEVDVSNSRSSIAAEEIEQLPVANVASAVGLQAGILGLSVRGSGSDELSFMVNGLTLRDSRDNSPFTVISLSSVQEVQVQTGGFNAEYGNVQSGIVNVVTKEGSPDRYSFDAIVRYSPPAQKHFGAQANDFNAYWIRPFVDPDVAFTGTESGAWDEYTQRQYPRFDGWNALSRETLEDDDPTNDLSPEGLQKAFLWQHRKQFEITEPDYEIDVGVGGPIPGLRKTGARPRFFVTYRREQDMYLIPLNTDKYLEWSAHGKLTLDVGSGKKLSLQYLEGRQEGTGASRAGQPGLFRSPEGIAGSLSRVSFIDSRTFSTDYWGPSSVKSRLVGGKFTHALSASTFYEVIGQYFSRDYFSAPGRFRNDSTAAIVIGGVEFDEAPFGFQPRPTFGVDGMRTGVGMSNSRDTSFVATWMMRADLTSQLNRIMQVKTGFEFEITDSRINYGSVDEFLPSGRSRSVWERSPRRAAVYGQTKLEFQGMIANLGLRLDYFHAGGDWWNYEVFDPAFSARLAAGVDTLLAQEPTDRIFNLSPRLGVSFPVTSSSKLYFNYGHFRQLPDPNNIFLFREETLTGAIVRLGDPNNPLPKNISYELGFEQSIFDMFLIKAAGYYKDQSLQPRLVSFRSRDGLSSYSVSQPVAYGDTRGFELTFQKDRGAWVRGFINYTYMVESFGYFGLDEFSGNPTEQRVFEDNDAERRAQQSRPVPRPYARVNLILDTPNNFGPVLGNARPLGDWTVSLLGFWRKGSPLSWANSFSVPPAATNNLRFKDFWDFDLRISKNFELAGNRAQFFIDINNLFNRKTLNFNGAFDGVDLTAYVASLHLPENEFYDNIPGDDKPGDYRDYDVAFQPMELTTVISETRPAMEGVIYYNPETRQFLELSGEQLAEVEQGRLDKILDTKAYIDMPNQSYLTFLN